MKKPLFFALRGLTCLLAMSCIAKAQQNPNGQLPVTSVERPFLFLVKDPLVHKELQLSPQQREAVAALNDELDSVLWSTRNQPRQRADSSLEEATSTAKRRLSSVLSQEQLRRLRQIEMWTLGMKVFLREDLSAPLELTDSQRTTIRDTVTETQDAIRELANQLQTGAAREGLEKKARSLKVDEQKQIVATLTRRQQQQWIDMLGKKIDVAKLGRLHFKAPEFAGRNWLNSTPLTLRQLKGKVVALHFYAFA